MAKKKTYTVEEAADLIKAQLLFDKEKAKAPAGDPRGWEILEFYEVEKQEINIPLTGGGCVRIKGLVLKFTEADTR